MGRLVADKWLKTEALLTNPRLEQHIPKTKLYEARILKRMLHRFGMVVIKPVRGSGGYGVIKVEQEHQGFAYYHKSRKKTFDRFEALYRSLERTRLKCPYLIQQGIDIAEIHGRPVDYRVKMIKVHGSWETRAVVGRMARTGLFVTNLAEGGTQLRGRQAIRLSVGKRYVRGHLRTMRELTKACISVFEQHFPGVDALGMDYGIDTSGRIWIFEVNTKPQ